MNGYMVTGGSHGGCPFVGFIQRSGKLVCFPSPSTAFNKGGMQSHTHQQQDIILKIITCTLSRFVGLSGGSHVGGNRNVKGEIKMATRSFHCHETPMTTSRQHSSQVNIELQRLLSKLNWLLYYIYIFILQIHSNVIHLQTTDTIPIAVHITKWYIIKRKSSRSYNRRSNTLKEDGWNICITNMRHIPSLSRKP